MASEPPVLGEVEFSFGSRRKYNTLTNFGTGNDFTADVCGVGREIYIRGAVLLWRNCVPYELDTIWCHKSSCVSDGVSPMSNRLLKGSCDASSSEVVMLHV